MTQQSTTDRATLLRAAIADIAPRHAALPRIGADANGSWIASHDRHRAAAEELLRHIRRQHGAKARVGLTDPSRLQLHGITVTSVRGLAVLIDAWLAKARDQLKLLEPARLR